MVYHYLNASSEGIEIHYSQRDNLSYIRSETPQTVSLDYLIRIPTPRPVLLPRQVVELRNFCHSFKAGPLKLDHLLAPRGIDYLNCIIDQNKGSCRHRAAVFKHLMKQNAQIPVRIIMNECHDFVELYLADQWFRVDLGGYPAQLIYHNPHPLDTTKTADAQENDVDDLTPYLEFLTTWNKKTVPFNAVDDYVSHLISNHKINCLVECSSSQDINALQLSIQAFCRKNSRAYFCINTPEDLVCSANFVSHEPNQTKGVMSQGPGGMLHQFLSTQQSPVLIINYQAFDASEVVGSNTLFDERPFADNTPLPLGTLVIALTNVTKSDCYKGADFYSRLHQIESLPLSSQTLMSYVNEIVPLTLVEDDTESYVIDLYNQPDWKGRLLGYWMPKNDHLEFVEGALNTALASGLPITLKNANWRDETFLFFWRQALLQGFIDYEGFRIDLPQGLKLGAQQGYPWATLSQHACFDGLLRANELTLHSDSFSEFFLRYECQNGRLNTLPGWIELHAHQTLHVNLTASLSDDLWAMMLSRCAEQHVRLEVHCDPNVELPAPIAQTLPECRNTLPHKDHTLVLQSNDIDTTAAQLTEQGGYRVIDVSECTGTNLLSHIEARILGDDLKFETVSGVLETLKENRKIILKGSFSQELIDSLTTMLFHRYHDPKAPGQLIILSDSPCFHYLPTKHCVIGIEDKKKCLLRHFSAEAVDRLDHSLITTESLSQLRARLSFWHQHPEALSSDDAWRGLKGLSGGINFAPFDAEHSAEITEQFITKRLAEVKSVLEKEPFVFLTGLTGVGKSTFVQHYLQSPHSKLYEGESQKIKWAQDKSYGRKILFIDEANLSPNHWSEFEGLYATPPSILIKGTYYPLTPEHKVIFAGNPLNYGDGRHIASFFARHGNALVFDPLPQEFIFETVLKPVLAKTNLHQHTVPLCEPFFAVYRFVCGQSQDKVLISPRELQMMALFLWSADQEYYLDFEEALLAAQHYAYQVGYAVLPGALRSSFDAVFKPQKPLPRASKPIVNEHFLNTPSRNEVSTQLHRLLHLRESRCDHKRNLNEAQLYGGLGGFIIEGAPGIGKSELVIASLKAHGYVEVHLTDEMLPERPFFRIPATMQLSDKKELLLTAFDVGAIVLIDEINCSTSMERLLNSLLMGAAPNGRRPKEPGFFIIGTQNPPTMNGRSAPSTALSRRVMMCFLPEYSREEMKDILINRGLDEKTALKMVTAYQRKAQEARTQHLTPAPTLRDLLQLADKVIEEQPNNPPKLMTLMDFHGFFADKKHPLEDVYEEEQRKRMHLAGHPERNEGSPGSGSVQGSESLRCAQDDVPEVEQLQMGFTYDCFLVDEAVEPQPFDAMMF